jgi:NAD+ synthase
LRINPRAIFLDRSSRLWNHTSPGSIPGGKQTASRVSGLYLKVTRMQDFENTDLMSRMLIDCERVSNAIAGFIRDKMLDGGREGVCIGLSGGVDSAVAAVLAVRATGDPSTVHGLNLCDRDSQGKYARYARTLARDLGMNLTSIDISPRVRAEGTYRPFIMKLVPYSRLINEMILLSNRIGSRVFYRETPFAMTLRREDPSSIRFGSIARIAKNIENGFNTRHVQRRLILEEYAREHNLLLIGAANRSESFVGWFVKDGVDDLPVETLLGLYKNQVRQLARWLEVPECILAQAPSPDMFKGIGDEELIGHKYDVIDRVAYVAEHGLDEELLVQEGITRDEIEHIKRLHELSAWKRENEHDFPSIEMAETLMQASIEERTRVPRDD